MLNRYHKSIFFFLLLAMSLLHANVQIDDYQPISEWEEHKEALLLLIIMAFVSLYYFIRISKLNRALQLSKSQLEEHEKELEQTVEKRTNEKMELEVEKYKNFEHILQSFINIIEDRDAYTAGHSQRVAHYSRLIAEHMGHSKKECDLVYHAGILHDIGKVATPDSILMKPDLFDVHEKKLIEGHVNVSFKILSAIPMYMEMAEIILYHHERYDGKGYPYGVKGNDIPILSHIMIVADAFDAMTTSRIYQVRKSIPEAIEEIRTHTSTQFHPQVAQAAIEVFSEIKDIHTFEQLPTTQLEQERFSYFYRNQLTSVYNQNYLNFILNKNFDTMKYICFNVLYLHNFSISNQKEGWEYGNELLINFAKYLRKTYPNSLIFRIHSVDFCIMSTTHTEIDIEMIKKLDSFTKSDIAITHKHIDLREINMGNLQELEAELY
ncbi:HD-GYP domain-containing protein [Sulfurovum sp.]|uniref:HD-GYP domain-containing protein n=1 Tax=Sulfurovum sp. TaxID=1969726 RepID=UPI003567A356